MQWCFVPQKNISHNVPSLPSNKTRNSDVKDTGSSLIRGAKKKELHISRIITNSVLETNVM